MVKQQTVKHLLCTRYCSRCWDTAGQTDANPTSGASLSYGMKIAMAKIRPGCNGSKRLSRQSRFGTWQQSRLDFVISVAPKALQPTQHKVSTCGGIIETFRKVSYGEENLCVVNFTTCFEVTDNFRSRNHC